ncbi:hypothetical protein LguiB_007951 [Lonicera macranthoides]
MAMPLQTLLESKLERLNLRAVETPMLMRFQNVKPAPNGFSPKCLCFGIYGSLEFGNVLRSNVCSTTKQGHFAIVVELAVQNLL